jgi:hypothetical protein
MKEDTRQLIATLEEQSKFTGNGILALVLLILYQLAMVGAIGSANGAVQEAAIGTAWIAGNVLLGVFVIVGRRRTYRVMRENQ